MVLQLLADVIGRSVYQRDDAEATAFGAYLVARVGMGAYPDIRTASAALLPGGRFSYKNGRVLI